MKINIKSTWIWYPGDFEIWQHLKISLRRKERQTSVPTFWKVDTYYPSVVFRKELNLDKPEKVKVYADGDFHIMLDSVRLRYAKDIIEIPKGKHTFSIAVANQNSIPAIFVKGETIKSDGSWEVTIYDQTWHKAGYWNLDSKEIPPSKFKLPVTEVFPVNIDKHKSSYFIDFDKEIYASLKLSTVSGKGNISIYYGESFEEAMSIDHCVLVDSCEAAGNNLEYTFELKAFRYANIVCEGKVSINKFSAFFVSTCH